MNYYEVEQFLQNNKSNSNKNSVKKDLSIDDILIGNLLKLCISDIINVDDFILKDGKKGKEEFDGYGTVLVVELTDKT